MAKKKENPMTLAVGEAIKNIEESLYALYELGFDDGYSEAELDQEKGKN